MTREICHIAIIPHDTDKVKELNVMAQILTDGQKRKYDFCENELSRLLTRAYNYKAVYYVKNDTELVDIINRQGDTVHTVNVTWDSLIALARDVINTIEM